MSAPAFPYLAEDYNRQVRAARRRIRNATIARMVFGALFGLIIAIGISAAFAEIVAAQVNPTMPWKG